MKKVKIHSIRQYINSAIYSFNFLKNVVIYEINGIIQFLDYTNYCNNHSFDFNEINM